MPRWVFLLLGIVAALAVAYFFFNRGKVALPSGSTVEAAGVSAADVINYPGNQYGNLT